MKSVHYSQIDEERNFVPKMRASMPDLRESVKKARHSSTDIINRLSQHRKCQREKRKKILTSDQKPSLLLNLKPLENKTKDLQFESLAYRAPQSASQKPSGNSSSNFPSKLSGRLSFSCKDFFLISASTYEPQSEVHCHSKNTRAIKIYSQSLKVTLQLEMGVELEMQKRTSLRMSRRASINETRKAYSGCMKYVRSGSAGSTR